MTFTSAVTGLTLNLYFARNTKYRESAKLLQKKGKLILTDITTNTPEEFNTYQEVEEHLELSKDFGLHKYVSKGRTLKGRYKLTRVTES